MLTRDVLRLDPAATVDRITATLRRQIMGELHRRGAVVGVSGGVDSAVVTALCARAVGPDRVLAVFMPERDSSEASLRLGRLVAERFGVASVLEDISAALEAIGCYARQEAAIREVFPEYGAGWRCKLTLPSVLETDRLNVFHLTVQSPSGEQRTSRMSASAYLSLVAATNLKQRIRKTLEYTHADRLQYAVAGTPNLLEYDQGFFVKQGDGAADVKPIAHLYKTEVYQLAEYLGVPEEIRSRPPTTDTYSLEQTQEEFFFALRWDRMDLCLWAHDRAVAPAEVAPALQLSAEQVARVYKDIESKRRATRYLHEPALLIGRDA